MREFAPFLQAVSRSVTLFTLIVLPILFSASCGNKGDLYLPSDVVSAEELKEASDKLKKRKQTTAE